MMLSIVDLYREIGKSIFISPFNTSNIRDNSIDFTASMFAWSPDKTYLYDEASDYIIIPPRNTACILTEESIYVTGKIGGTYHSRVSLVTKGLGHISTMLDPLYCGQSLIALQNLTNDPIPIKRGERIVSIVFYYLKTPIKKGVLANAPSHIDKVAALDSAGLYRAWANDNPWVNNPVLLKNHFLEHDAVNLKADKRDRFFQIFF